MVKSIINVRRSSICWRGRRELITDVRKLNHGYDVIVGGELFTDYSDHPRKLVTLNPKLKSTGAGLPASFPLVGCLPQATAELPKSQDAVALQQIEAWRFTYD